MEPQIKGDNGKTEWKQMGERKMVRSVETVSHQTS